MSDGRTIETVAVGDIDASGRLRPADEAYVAAIAESIAARGLIVPVLVRRLADGTVRLVDGLHRLEAHRALGRETIAVMYREGDELAARLDEIDTGLMVNTPRGLDRALFLAERQRIYETLYPQTRRGVAGGRARQGSATEMFSFADEVARRTDLHARTVRNAVAVARGLAPDVVERLRGTATARKDAELKALAALPADRQRRVVDRMFADRARPLGVRAALRALAGAQPSPAPVDVQYAALIQAWTRAGEAARERFRRHLDAEARGE